MHALPRALLRVVLAFAACLAAAQSSAPAQGQAAAAPEQDPTAAAIARAQALMKAGKADQALSIYQSLLPDLQAREASAELGQVLTGLSQIAASKGDYPKAIEWAQESAMAFRSVRDTHGESDAWNDKGIAEVQTGDYAAAHEDFERALELSRASGDGESQVRVLNNLGIGFFYQGEYFEALRQYQAAGDVLTRFAGEPWAAYRRQITQFNLATLYQRLGRYETALATYRELAATDKTLKPSDQAHLAANLGALYRRLGDPWKALESYGAAQKLYAAQHDSDGEIGVLKNIGIVYALERNDLKSALRIFNQALTLADQTQNRREQMQAHLYLGETFLRQGERKSASDEFEQARQSAVELKTTEEQWKALYGLGQLQEQGGEAAKAEAHYREAVGIIEQARVQLQLSALRAEFLADKRDVYDALIRLLLDRGDIPDAFLFLERSRARTFQDRISANQKTAAASLTLDETQRYLEPRTLLLEFWVSNDRIAALWATHEKFGAVTRQVSRAQQESIEQALKTMPESADAEAALQAVRAALPFDAGVPLADARRLLIVPDGWTSIVPFDLVRTDPAGPMWIENYSLAYLPSASLLRRERGRAGAFRFPWTRQLVAFGDPAVPQAAEAGAGQDASPAALPFSGEEIRRIADMARGRSQLFVGEADRKQDFLAGQSNSAMLLHVSTHAFADEDNPEDSRLLFSPSQPGAGSDYVFLRELYGLDLHNVSLATLSACDTERGRVIRGEGVQAFSRALLSAGSQAALTTLWRVDDQATSEFMGQFYFYALEEHKPTAEALRLAKLKFLRSGGRLAHPMYWAAFVINGNGFDPLPRVISWSAIGVGLGLMTLLVTGAGALLLRRTRGFEHAHGSERIVSQQP